MNYWETIQNERQWSWSLVALVFILAALLIRQVIFQNLFFRIKRIPREFSTFIRMEYQKRAVFGWISFGISVGLVTWLWVNPKFLLSYFPELSWQLTILAFFFVSLFSHSQAYANALLKLIEEKLSSEKEV